MGFRNVITKIPPFRWFNKSTHTSDFYSGNDISVDNTTNTQLKLSTVYACVNILSNSISKMPFFIVDTATHKKVDDRISKQIKKLLSITPNKQMTACTFLKLMETNRLLHGNAYAVLQVGINGSIEALSPINPANVQVLQLENGEIVYNVTTRKKEVKQYTSDEMLHIKGISFDGIIGQSVLAYAKTVTQTTLLQEEYAANFYKRGGRPMAILKVATSLAKLIKEDPSGKTAKNIMRDDFEKDNGGNANVGRIAVLDEGSDYISVPQINMKDMAFVESKEISVADISRFFGVPEYKLNSGGQSYASNEQNSIAYVTDTLTPILIAYEQEFTLKLLPDNKIDSGYSIKGNLNAEMRGDLSTRGKWYQIQEQGGVYSPNEIRAYEDLPAIDGGDTRYMSLNYAPIELQYKWWEERVKQANDGHLQQIGQDTSQGQGGTTQ